MNSHRMNCHLIEIWLDKPRRSNPVTPAEMFQFYDRTRNHRPSRKDRFMAALGEALIALGQRVKPKNIAQTATPAYQGKK